MSKLPGITKEDEQEKLKRTIGIAEEKLHATKSQIQSLADELHEMLDVFDENDKEALALWHNTDARFKEVNQDLKRAERARKKPYFGRIDFVDKSIGKDEVYYLGRSVIAKNQAEPEVIDWRAPIASVYYDHSLGDLFYSVKGEGKYEITLKRKRTYEIENDQLKDYFDSDVVANDDLLTKYLAKSKRAVLGEIIATIQQEQNEIIRKKPQHNLIVQGAAGSGKTTVAMHRISYILYNYELEFDPQDFYIIGSNQVLLQYITGVLPDLDVYGVKQLTMEQLFIRLLYEDWNNDFSVKPVKKGVTPPVKGTLSWFQDLERFCESYVWNSIPREDVIVEKTGTVLLTKDRIEKIIKEFEKLSYPDLKEKLNEHLMAKFENEISGKYYSFSLDEKKRLTRFYETYFGKREWKGSIFEFYNNFLIEQAKKYGPMEMPEKEFDVYDLAALAYLYKKIKEEDIIREAGHVVIDEAQDFGMMVYGCLKYCLSKCTYTIMGDVSQNISLNYGLNDWKELRELMLPGEFDYFGLLKKSYRNTVEISQFATDILMHGSFQIYPVEPIIRHGEEVSVRACASYGRLISNTVETVSKWIEDGYETIAIVCKDQEEVLKVTKSLSGELELLPNTPGEMEFGAGVLVLSLEYTKGLEFDAVLLFDANADNYPVEDGYVKRLYVAATRALHQLTVLYQGELTPLIGTKVTEINQAQVVTESSKPTRKPMPVEEEKTNLQIAKERAREGEEEMARRNKIGPRRIVVNTKKPEDETNKTATTQENGILKSNAVFDSVKPVINRVNVEKKPFQEGETRVKAFLKQEPEEKPRTKPNYWEKNLPYQKKPVIEESNSEFGEMPDQNNLRPVGHGKIDCSLRFVMKDKKYLDLISAYGTLRLIPVSEDTIRIYFEKGQLGQIAPVLPQFEKGKFSFQSRETKDTVEIMTSKLWVRVIKKTGAVQFLTSKGRGLLCEREKEPRQVESNLAYTYFAFGKNEKLLAKGETDRELLKIGSSAKYISFGSESDRMPGLASENGYEILYPAGNKILCCNIGMYGPYVMSEGDGIIDYYFRVR